MNKRTEKERTQSAIRERRSSGCLPGAADILVCGADSEDFILGGDFLLRRDLVSQPRVGPARPPARHTQDARARQG
jgi:hypothetical protein